MKTSFDAIVIGNSLGGLLAAGILLAKRKRVLVVKTMSPETEADGYRLCHTPPFLWGLSPGRNLERALREMNVPVYKMKGIEPAEPPLQIVTHRHRIDLPSRRESMADVLSRYHPRDGDNLRAYLAGLPELRKHALERLNLAPESEPKGIWDRTLRRMQSAVERWTDSFTESASQSGLSGELIQDLQLLQAPFHSLSDPGGKIYTAITVLGHSQVDTFHFDGGGHGLLSELIELIAEFGGMIMEAGIRYVFADGQRIKAIELDESEDSLQARTFVWASSYLHFAQVMNESPSSARPRSYFLTPTHILLPIHLRAMKSSVPVGMGNYLTCRLPSVQMESAEPASGGGITDPWADILLMSVDKGRTQDEVGMVATTFIPAKGVETLEKTALEARDRVLQAVHEMFPFSEGKIRTVGWSDSLAFARNFVLNGNVLSRLDPEHGDSPVGLSLRSRWSNLFYSTSEIFPFWGLDGQALAGRLAARACLRQLAR